MIPENALVAFCPQCKGKKELIQLRSGNTFGTRAWSDGKTVSPMLPKLSPIQKCPHCNHFYLISRVKTKTGNRVSFEKGWLTFDEMLEAIEESKDWQLTAEGHYPINCVNYTFY